MSDIDSTVWRSRSHVAADSPIERSMLRRKLKREIGEQFVDHIRDGDLAMVRWQIEETPEYVEGRLELMTVYVGGNYCRPWQDWPSGMLLAEICGRAHRAVSRAVGRLAFWRKDGAK